MIPRTINYIWLSDEKPNFFAMKCMRSWKRLAPNYDIRRWSMKDFDFEKMPPFVNDAIQAKKWAFACDYLRLYILYNNGGLYLDSDVMLLKSPDKFLNNKFFSSVEYLPDVEEYKFQAAIMGSEPRHPFVKALMSVYDNAQFSDSEAVKQGGEIAPGIYARKAEEYGFVRENIEQELGEGIKLYKSEVFAPMLSYTTQESYMVHLCNGSWRSYTAKQRFRISISKLHELNSIKRMRKK